MVYLGPKGNRAEVNINGKITRLPWEDEGVPPPPGSKINPSVSCTCCPKGVHLQPETNPDEIHRPPRRDVVIDPTVPIASTNRCIGVYGDRLGYDGGYEPYENSKGADFKSLIGKPYKALLIPEDTPILPTPLYWVEWNAKKNTFKFVRLPTEGYTLYVWFEGSSGTVGRGLGMNGSGSSFNIESVTKKINTRMNEKNLKIPIPRAKEYKIIYKICDTNRIPWGRYQSAGDFPSYEFDPPIKAGDGTAQRMGVEHPLGEMWTTFLDWCDIEQFKQWYVNPEHERYEYGRVY